MQKRVILVVGASSGLGRSTARQLAQAGHIVYAGARSFAQGAQSPGGCTALEMDVSSDESVQRAVAQVIDAQGRLDVLVCCAAHFVLSPAEEIPLEQLRGMLEVNVLGMVRCVQAALVHMRAQGRGHVVLFSSLNGLFPIPFQGAYSMTKHAVEAYAGALAQETRRFGVHVTVVEPGDCRGGAQKYRRTHVRPDSPYTQAFLHGTEKIHHDESHGLAPERVGSAVSRAVNKKRPPSRLIVASPDQRMAVCLYKLLPRAGFHRLMEWYYR